MGKSDIRNREDIELLVNSFYDKVKQDPVIGFIFNDIARVDWPHHLPIMYDFWENVIFATGTYGRNAMEPHFRLNELVPLQPEHFRQWLMLFESTVHERFDGEKATLAIYRARSIKGIMELKINNPGKQINKAE